MDQLRAVQTNRINALNALHQSLMATEESEYALSDRDWRRTIRAVENALGPNPTQQEINQAILDVLSERPIRQPRSPTTIIPEDSTYDRITQQGNPQIQYGIGINSRIPPPLLRQPVRPAREIPIGRREACRCNRLHFDVALHLLERAFGNVLLNYNADARQRRRRQALGEAGLFSTTANHVLVDMRQARTLAGLDTSEYDVEIARRVLADPQGWGRLGQAMRQRGWIEEVIDQGENYVLR